MEALPGFDVKQVQGMGKCWTLPSVPKAIKTLHSLENARCEGRHFGVKEPCSVPLGNCQTLILTPAAVLASRVLSGEKLSAGFLPMPDSTLQSNRPSETCHTLSRAG